MDNKSISHSRWNCTYHIVFIPKYRRKIMYYCQIDKTGEYIMAADVLEECFDLYDSIGASDCSEEEIDTILNIFIQGLHERTLRGYYQELLEITQKAFIKLESPVLDHDIERVRNSAKEFLDTYLLLDKKKQPQDFSKSALKRYLKLLRLKEEGKEINE